MIQEIADNAASLACLVLVLAVALGIVISAFRQKRPPE